MAPVMTPAQPKASPTVASSARMESKPNNSQFIQEEKGSVKGSGSGYELPELVNLQWEANRIGGIEAWHCPLGAVHRKEKTYLGHLGKRQLAAWEQKTPAEFRGLVCEWIAEKRKAKGIE